MVLVKLGILYCDDRVLQVPRNVLEGNRDAFLLVEGGKDLIRIGKKVGDETGAVFLQGRQVGKVPHEGEEKASRYSYPHSQEDDEGPKEDDDQLAFPIPLSVHFEPDHALSNSICDWHPKRHAAASCEPSAPT